jgi:hypothetical protein
MLRANVLFALYSRVREVFTTCQSHNGIAVVLQWCYRLGLVFGTGAGCAETMFAVALQRQSHYSFTPKPLLNRKKTVT